MVNFTHSLLFSNESNILKMFFINSLESVAFSLNISWMFIHFSYKYINGKKIIVLSCTCVFALENVK